MFSERIRNCIKQAKIYPGSDMNSDHNPVVVKINMNLKRKNATKRSEQLELNLLKEETNKNKSKVYSANISGKARLSDATAKSVFNSKIKETVP